MDTPSEFEPVHGNMTWINSTEFTEFSAVFTPLEAFIVLMFVYAVIFTVGTFGNILIIWTVCKSPDMRSPSNLFVTNLAISDLAILFISLPASILQEFTSWRFGEVTCTFIFPLKDVFVSASILTLTVISLERHRCIVSPLKPKLLARDARLIIIGVWILSYLAVGLPMAFVMKVVTEHDGLLSTCKPVWKNTFERRIHKISLTAIWLILPLVIVAFVYTQMVYSLKRQRERIRRHSSCGSRRQVTEQIHQSLTTAHMLIVIAIFCWISLLPLLVFAMVYEFEEVHDFKHINAFLVVSLILFFSAAALNPIIIYMMSADLRQHAGVVWDCCGIRFFSKVKLSWLKPPSPSASSLRKLRCVSKSESAVTSSDSIELGTL